MSETKMREPDAMAHAVETPESSYGWWRWRWTWFKAYCRGMPFGYREWRSRVDSFLITEAGGEAHD